jgi:hypothetical protein
VGSTFMTYLSITSVATRITEGGTSPARYVPMPAIKPSLSYISTNGMKLVSATATSGAMRTVKPSTLSMRSFVSPPASVR